MHTWLTFQKLSGPLHMFILTSQVDATHPAQDTCAHASDNLTAHGSVSWWATRPAQATFARASENISHIYIYNYIYTSMYISPHCLQHRYLNDGNEFVRLIKNHFVCSFLNLCLFTWIMLNAHACRRAPNLERLKFKDRFFLMSKGSLSLRTDRLWKIDLQM